MKFFIIILLAFVAINCYRLENIHEKIEHNYSKINNSISTFSNQNKASTLALNSKNKNSEPKKQKFKPIVYDGYSLDINIGFFKSIVFY